MVIYDSGFTETIRYHCNSVD
ncbi:Protein of unknown function [Pyronema omphalodes CBS 100304]|uniref:Uncharacterized protein n=1 Tax=Pyronema omphalodes (strain CBS 100304) TaxID=1076935 RepID=U4KWZ4_PYROM|nr:Protein of unknown function [Pyronema omphalodes CBS 100304]